MKLQSKFWNVKQIALLLLLLIIACLATFCRKDKEDPRCSSYYEQPPIRAISFNQISIADYDSSYLVYYPINSNFQNPIDTFYFLDRHMHNGSDNLVNIIIYNDGVNPPDALNSHYDWIIVIKKISKEYKVTDFQFEIIDCKGKQKSILISYKVDGVIKIDSRVTINR